MNSISKITENINNFIYEYDSSGVVLDKASAANDQCSDKKTESEFWFVNPNILFQKDRIFEFFPVESMNYNDKLNALSRSIILLTVISFIVTHNMRILAIGMITLGSIVVLYLYHEREIKKMKKEGYEDPTKGAQDPTKGNNDPTKGNTKGYQDPTKGYNNPASDYLKQNNLPVQENAFIPPSKENPFQNVMLTDYDYNPNKKPAGPSYNKKVNGDILSQAKNIVQELNPDQPDIADKLFKDLGDQYVFEQSMQPFYSTASTTIPNDQGAFADFCYGSMVSCKEGNLFACARNLARHIN
jgi:hypothetical protein